MNKNQFVFILVTICIALVVPWFSVGMFFMGLAIGAYLFMLLARSSVQER